MCGFLGEFCYNPLNATNHLVFLELLALSKHRGPDATEHCQNENFQFGFNRLAILDLSDKGNQPMQSPSARYTMVFNGEIYNFKALIDTYQLDNLESTCDSEVIVHLLDLMGVQKTISVLNGMFAIAISDNQENILHLSRDFAGIKPLFYGLSSKGVVSASQFNQVFKHSWFKDNLKLRPEIVKEYFGFGYMQAPNTVFQGIYQVSPGEMITIDKNGSLVKKIITSFSKLSINFDLEEKVLQRKLVKAVERQLVSDVPIATFLSGGIDSPLISAYAKKSKTDIEAFTLEVEDEKVNESKIAKLYAKKLDLNHQLVSIRPEILIKKIDEHFLGFPEPFGDYSSIPTYAVCEKAKQTSTVMLSGDGGDELFLGYPRMLDAVQKSKWFKLPYFLRKNLFRVTNKLKITNTWAPIFNTFNEFVINKHLHIPLWQLNKFFQHIDFSKDITELYNFNTSNRKELIHQLKWNEFYAHLQRVLIKVDRASMKNSLEVRVPFLDKKIIDYSWNYTNDFDNKKDLKNILKSLLADEVSQDLLNEEKMGFTVPLHEWLHKQLKDDVQHHIFDIPFYGHEVLSSGEIKNYVSSYYKGEHNNCWGVWHIYAWQKWATLHLDF